MWRTAPGKNTTPPTTLPIKTKLDVTGPSLSFLLPMRVSPLSLALPSSLLNIMLHVFVNYSKIGITSFKGKKKRQNYKIGHRGMSKTVTNLHYWSKTLILLQVWSISNLKVAKMTFSPL